MSLAQLFRAPEEDVVGRGPGDATQGLLYGRRGVAISFRLLVAHQQVLLTLAAESLGNGPRLRWIRFAIMADYQHRSVRLEDLLRHAEPPTFEAHGDPLVSKWVGRSFKKSSRGNIKAFERRCYDRSRQRDGGLA
jgi:hypothetical protein